ncbi:hypothetical protein [Magnetospirillum sulfuroxidans]|uniref:Uncharacterized protein n=1 Tax=Magnetospirillum sulfuroxidans TaxID=611300 RepID=A0ABS5IGZ7_9PROT|nr:hypothetical protein [Magnetospirillum sulfuroxidans]MBR9973705.1 hypothetical protein [Magnetospirillum sulfuroxidans]
MSAYMLIVHTVAADGVASIAIIGFAALAQYLRQARMDPALVATRKF